MTTAAPYFYRPSLLDIYRPDNPTFAARWDAAQAARHQGHVGPPTCHPCTLVGFYPNDPPSIERACPRCACLFNAALQITTDGLRCDAHHRDAIASRVDRIQHLRAARPVHTHQRRTKRHHARQGPAERSLP